MQHCDALIVGGGPAGSTAARALRSAGFDVIVLDKAAFPRDKTCAGWITPPVLDLLDLDVADYRKSREFQPITGFRVGRIGGPLIGSNYNRPVSYAIRRCEFDNYLLQRSGATLRLGQPLRSFKRRDNLWCINDEIESPILIGAGGHFCPIARKLNESSESTQPLVAAQEVEFEMSPDQADRCKVDANLPELYFCPDLTGYGWCVRKHNHLNVGLGREDPRALSSHVAKFVDQLKQSGRIPPDTPPKFHGHAYILYTHTRPERIADGVLLIGDAAGLAHPRTGEGIRTAIESALLAAQTILAAHGDYRRENLAPYTAALTKKLGPPESQNNWFTHIPMRIKQAIAAHLFATRWFTRKVVLDRWFLAAS